MSDLMKQVKVLIDDYVKKNTAGVGLSGNDVQLTKNFKLSEFACKCGGARKYDCKGATLINTELVRRMQKMRTECGKPIRIISALRCPSYNERTPNASENSQHMYGTAVDFVIVGGTLAEARKLAEKYFSDGGVGYYNSHTHVDVRGSKARWDNR